MGWCVGRGSWLATKASMRAMSCIDVVADLYKIDLEGVRQAVEFERRLVARRYNSMSVFRIR
jgi:hypothetical protein